MKVTKLRNLVIKGLVKPFDYFQLKSGYKTLQKRSFKYRRHFDLDRISSRDCKWSFRFTKTQIRRLVQALEIPSVCVTTNGVSFTGLEGFCILLRRLCYPNRLCELEDIFHRDFTILSRIANWMTNFLYSTHGHLLTGLSQSWVDLELFSMITSNAGCVYPNIVGFIDGTARSICRPCRDQKEQYSGYYKEHVLKYQSIVTPNGLILRLDGPFNGRRHDSAVLQLSYLLRDCRNSLHSNGKSYAFYGDPGYANQKYIKVGYKNKNRITRDHKQFNRDMSALRVSVEYGFGKIIQQFAFCDYKKNQKLLLQPVKCQYIVAAILTNCHTCLNGSQVSDYFNCSPPTLEQYLA